MRLIANLCVFLAVAFVSVKLEAKAVGEAAGNVAEAVVSQVTDKVNETPQVEHKGGFRQQVLHKGVDVASSSLMKKGAAVVLSSAAKYPLMAAAAPVALPLAKAVVAAVVVNQVHKKINNMRKNKSEASNGEQGENPVDHEIEESDKQKKGLVDKLTSAFTKDKPEEEASKTEDSGESETEKSQEKSEEPVEVKPEEADQPKEN